MTHVQPNSVSVDELLGQIANEFFDRLVRGDDPQIEDYANRYPQLADQIRLTFSALELVGESLSCSSESLRPKALENEQQLGDFKLVKELGRGGMGIVYEAEQISMGRRVALKVLPFAKLASEKSLQRFRNEVRAAATLDHPNIVSVYSVGEERGINYYAMQLIRGASLASVIEDLAKLDGSNSPLNASSIADMVSGLDRGTMKSDGGSVVSTQERTPPSAETKVVAAATTLPESTKREFFLSVASIGAQAATALHYSHEQGIVHRDVKPANLIIDVENQVHIADFGLARVEAEAGVTMTGDVVGTLRYMAPEQALANRIVVDHRVDIYSLGATLYEFLALRPMFDARDRSTLLRKLTFEDPEPLRQVAKGIPRDLETIVHKAISKNPDERYSSAAELADDLRAFQGGIPIVARPPSFFDLASKWSRRHPTVVASVIATLLVTVSVLSVAFFAVSREKSATAEALAQKADALIEAKRNLDEAQEARRSAEDNLTLAVNAVDDMYKEFATDWISTEVAPSTQQLGFLDKAANLYKAIASREASGDLDPRLAGEARARIGEIRLYLEEFEGAVVPLQEAVEIARELHRLSPEDESHRAGLVRRSHMLATAFTELAMFDEAKAANSEALRNATELLASGSTIERQYDLADCRLLQIRLMTLEGRLSEAEELTRKMWKDSAELKESDAALRSPVQYLRVQQQFLRVRQQLANIFLQRGKPGPAKRTCEDALSACQNLRNADYIDARSLIHVEADLIVILGDVEVSESKFVAGTEHYRKALDLRRQAFVAKVRPEVIAINDRDDLVVDGHFEPGPFHSYVEIQLKLADALRRMERPFQAELVLGECEVVAATIAAYRPESLRYRVTYANTLADVTLLLADKRPKEATAARLLAAKTWAHMLRDFPNAMAYRSGARGSEQDHAWFQQHFPNAIADTDNKDLDSAEGAFWETHFVLHAAASSMLRDGDLKAAEVFLERESERSDLSVAYDRLLLAQGFAERGLIDDAKLLLQRSINASTSVGSTAEYQEFRRQAEQAIASSNAFEVEDYRRRQGGQLIDRPSTREPEVIPTISIGEAKAVEGNRDLIFLDRFVSGVSLAGPFRSQTFGPDGNDDGVQDLYVVSGRTNEILRFDGISGGLIDIFVTAGSGGLLDPVDLRFGPDGHLYVTSGGTKRKPAPNAILRYNGETGVFLDTFVTGLGKAISFDFDDRGDLFVANRDTNEVLRFDGRTGESCGVFVSEAAGESGSLRQSFFGTDSNGDGVRDLYVLDNGNRKILRYDGSTGSFLGTFADLSNYSGLGWSDCGPQGDFYVSARSDETELLRLDGSTGAVIGECNLDYVGWSIMVDERNVVHVSANGSGPFIDRVGDESMATFAIRLSSPSNATVTVDFSTTDDVARACDGDYQVTSGTVSIAPGQTSRTIVVPTIDDDTSEDHEAFIIDLSNPLGAEISGTGRVAGKIIDDDTQAAHQP